VCSVQRIETVLSTKRNLIYGRITGIVVNFITDCNGRLIRIVLGVIGSGADRQPNCVALMDGSKGGSCPRCRIDIT
jgi:hypothetical protein